MCGARGLLCKYTDNKNAYSTLRLKGSPYIRVPRIPLPQSACFVCTQGNGCAAREQVYASDLERKRAYTAPLFVQRRLKGTGTHSFLLFNNGKSALLQRATKQHTQKGYGAMPSMDVAFALGLCRAARADRCCPQRRDNKPAGTSSLVSSIAGWQDGE
ncbi:hypothetical protein GQ54DRAFT_178468 [Martensiomyces pterosporus]|nr:hypothetical protein GQ54DRAFT_178468 [Martensiomyces pterosporus]